MLWHSIWFIVFKMIQYCVKRSLFFGVVIFLFLGCTEDKPKQQLDGEKLLEHKCAKCHNLDMPPKSYENELAPSMMAVTFHLKDFIKSDNPAAHESKIINFVKEYVISPSAEKSLCDKESLESYGVMPSQKGNVSLDEIEAIVHYTYRTYDNEKLLKVMAEKNRLARLPLQERVFDQEHCQYCHKLKKDGIAPSFQMIANRYSQKDKATLVESIRNGSKGKWQGKTMPMLGFKNISDVDIAGVVDWILKQK